MKVSRNKIVALRKERGWSQITLAAVSGLGERTIQRIEKEGTCSLESAMALASVYELSPKDLQTGEETQSPTTEPVNTNPEINWIGLVGMIVLLICAYVVIDLTSKYPSWEKISAGLIISLTFTFSCVTHGARHTMSCLAASRWFIRGPSLATEISNKITILKTMRDYAYIVGTVSSLVCGLTILVHSNIDPTHLADYFTYAIRPLVYAILLSELWLRPLKLRLEYILKLSVESHKGAAKP